MNYRMGGVALALLLAGAGCTQAQVVHTGSAASTQNTAIARKVTRPSTPAKVARPVRPTAAPVTRDGPCPYLDTQFVMDTVGQHLERTTVTTTVPATCTFYRPDAAMVAEVAGQQLDTPAAAAAKALALTGSGANPVSGVGDGGAVALTDSGTVLAVSRGTTLLVITLNQQSSLEATELARQALAHL